MNSEQNDAGSFQRDPALNGNLPEVLIERQHDARFGFGQIQRDDVFPSSAISAGPNYILAVGAKCLDDWLRKVLIGEKAHLRWNRIGLVFVGQIAGVRQAGKNVLSRQSGIVDREVVLGLAGCEEFQNELDGETRPTDHWFARQDFGIHDDALLPYQSTTREAVGPKWLLDELGNPGRTIDCGWCSLVAVGNG